MYERELKRVKKKLKKIFGKQDFGEQHIYLFGASDNTRQIIRMLREFGLEPAGILDNDPIKQNSYCAGVIVKAVQDIVDRDKKSIFLIYSFFWKEMTRQLKKNGISGKNLFRLCRRKPTLFRQIIMAYQGRQIYKRITKEYGNIPIFLCPYTGTGDIYLIGTFWRKYLLAEKINDYVFMVINRACMKAAQIFDIKNIELLKKEDEVKYLIKYYMLCPQDIPLKILNDSWGQVHSNLLQWFRGYKGLYFTELFRRFVFSLPDDTLPEKPLLKNVEKELNRIFQNNDLLPGRTVILSPYANTLADLPLNFWMILANDLRERGYVTVTNGRGEKEPAIPGTKSVFFPLDIAPQFVSKAGYFIGVRSGFCDVISAAHAKKIVLYDKDNRFFNCSAYEYFNLKQMQLCNDAVEIEFENRNVYGYMEKILNEFL